MRKITKQVLIDCADNLLFNLSDIELEKLEKDFENFISQIDFLNFPLRILLKLFER